MAPFLAQYKYIARIIRRQCSRYEVVEICAPVAAGAAEREVPAEAIGSAGYFCNVCYIEVLRLYIDDIVPIVGPYGIPA